MSQISNKFLYLSMSLMLFSGAGNTILAKLLIECQDNNGNKFKHPYIITLFTFTAGSIGLIIYMFYFRSMLKRYKAYNNIPEVIKARESGK